MHPPEFTNAHTYESHYIKQWQTRFSRLRLRAIWLEQNYAADWLASIGTRQDVLWKEYDLPPPGLEDIISDGLMGIPIMRRVVITDL